MALQIHTKGAEVKLMQMIGARQGELEWRGIHFHLNDLLEEYKSEYQIKIALNLINDLLRSYEGGLFLLVDSSIIVLCHKLEQPILEKLTFQLRYLYMDDPLAYTDTGDENPAFCTHYDLKRNWTAFYTLCSKRAVMSTRKSMQPPPALAETKPERQPEMEEVTHYPVLEEKPSPKPVIPKTTPAKPSATLALSASKLAAIEDSLRVSDISQVIRRQPVCAVLQDMNVRRLFDELYINIAHLRKIINSDVDFLSNRWLFKYLTHILDERMIKLIQGDPKRYLESPISLNFNVETLLSSWFTEFDAAISPATKVGIVLEIPVIDVFADMTAYNLARTEVQKLGYRVCLDGLTTATLTSINRERLGIDLVKVQWNADMQADLTSPESKATKSAIEAAGNNRVILCRCDNKSAIEYGQALGISLYQGRYLDRLLNPTSKVEN